MAEMEFFQRASRSTHEEATHEQNRAEDKYDTRGLEASYLARGQSKQLVELEQAIAEFEALPVKEFDASTPIDLGALVELQSDGERSLYFVGPRAGGTEVQSGKETIMVITPQSPLGLQLIGKKEGQKLQLTLGPEKTNT